MRSDSLLTGAGIGLLVVLHFISASSHMDIYAQDAPLLCPLPASETGTIIISRLMKEGFEITRTQSEIHAVKGNERWNIMIKPYSPLASHVTSIYTADGSPVPDKVKELHTFIRSMKGNSGGDIPGAIHMLKEYTVCIRAGSNGDHIQFTGFIVGQEGLIVSIAHDLDTVQEVTVTLDNGEEMRGRVIRMDFDRDLSLIDINRAISSPVSLSHARNLLEPGETVYSIGCSGNNQSRLHTGIIKGPPGLVNNMPLWQADMETQHGTSGGPVFDIHGNLVGIVKGRYRGTNTRGFIITVETLIDFLRER